MIAYSSLANKYDSLTSDVPYSEFIDIYKSEFTNKGGEFNLLLDLCCGTGTMTKLLIDEGFEMIAVDASEEMLMEAREKCGNILMLCQDATELDLYGTVDAAISSLDSINYIPPENFKKMLKRLHYFIRPEGLFIFDIRPEDWLKNMDGVTSVDESDDTLCLWRADFDNEINALIYGIDLFVEDNKGKWDRFSEEHIEYVYEIDQIRSDLCAMGFDEIKIIKKFERFFISCVRKC